MYPVFCDGFSDKQKYLQMEGAMHKGSPLTRSKIETSENGDCLVLGWKVAAQGHGVLSWIV
jgi:hypothetical protein